MDNDENEDKDLYNHVFTMRPYERELYLDSFFVFPVWYADYLEYRGVIEELVDEEVDKDIEHAEHLLNSMKLRARYNMETMHSFKIPMKMEREDFETFIESLTQEKLDELLKDSKVL